MAFPDETKMTKAEIDAWYKAQPERVKDEYIEFMIGRGVVPTTATPIPVMSITERESHDNEADDGW